VSLRGFLAEMQKKSQLVQINDEVSPRFEVSAFMKEFDGGPILYFDNVKGSRSKIVAGVCGTRQRLCWALGVSQEALYQRIIEAWREPAQPKVVRGGPVNEVVEKARLSKLPVLTHFEHDAGAYVTSSVISARSPDGKIENVSIHRLQVLDDNHLAIRLVPRHLYNMWKTAKEKKETVEVAITIGTHPAVMLAAASPVPFGVSEFGAANKLLNNKMTLVKCEHVNAYAPAEAELVLEGRILTDKEVIEGPLVDITGTYDIQRKQPVVELVSMMHRRDYMYQALLPSGSEHKLLMGLPHETMIWEAASRTVPRVKAVNLTQGGCGWLHAIVSIDKLVDGDAKNALAAVFGAHPSLKHAVVVDTDIDVYDLSIVEWAIATRFQANEDLVIIPQARGSTLDPSADQETGLTTKVGVDATRPLNKPREKFELARIPPNEKLTETLDKLKKTVEKETK
jgi:2,5-furandicarboxylate decarboxylase 1